MLYSKYQVTIIQNANYFSSIGVLAVILACFAENRWGYSLVSGISLLALLLATRNFHGMIGDQCPWELRSQNYVCQLMNIRNKMSLISNIVTLLLGALFTTAVVWRIGGVESLIPSPSLMYTEGFMRVVVLYLILDRVHNTNLLVTLYRHNETRLSHFTIGRPWLTDGRLYPKIYLDGYQIAPRRYRAIHENHLIGVSFSPTLSLAKDSVVEFEMIPEDPEHVVFKEPICSHDDHSRCTFRCRAIILPRITTQEQVLAVINNKS